MKIINYVLLVCCFMACNQKKDHKNNTANSDQEVRNSSKERMVDSTKVETGDIFLINEYAENVSWKISQKNKANTRREIDTLEHGYRIKDYLKYNTTFPYREGKLFNLNGKNHEDSKAFGQWFVFHNDSERPAVTGFYKNGLKDSFWITNYEDYPVPRFEFYKEGQSTNYQGNVEIKDNKNRTWFEGFDMKFDDLTQGHYLIYRYDLNQVFEYRFKEENDSIAINQRISDLKTNEFLQTKKYKVAKEI